MSRLLKALIGTMMLGFASEAFGQGCVMCLTGAMSQGVRAMGAMNLGVLILLVPAFLILVAIFLFTFLRRS